MEFLKRLLSYFVCLFVLFTINVLSSKVKAVKLGHVLVVDEADKAPTNVTCILKTLVENGEMILADGRRIVASEYKKATFLSMCNFNICCIRSPTLAGCLSTNNKHKFSISQVVCIDNCR